MVNIMYLLNISLLASYCEDVSMLCYHANWEDVCMLRSHANCEDVSMLS